MAVFLSGKAVFLSGKAFGYLQPGQTQPWFWRPPITQAGQGEDFQAQAGAWISIYQLTCSSVQKVSITMHYGRSYIPATDVNIRLPLAVPCSSDR